MRISALQRLCAVSARHLLAGASVVSMCRACVAGTYSNATGTGLMRAAACSVLERVGGEKQQKRARV